MKPIKGVGAGVELERLQKKAEQVSLECDARWLAGQKMKRGEPVLPENAGPSFSPSAGGASVLAAEAAHPQSRIDWERLPRLRKATQAEIDAAFFTFRRMCDLESGLGRLLKALAEDAMRLPEPPLRIDEARGRYHELRRLVSLVDAIRKAISAAGECAATASFPYDQLALIEGNAAREMKALMDAHGLGVQDPPPRRAESPPLDTTGGLPPPSPKSPPGSPSSPSQKVVWGYAYSEPRPDMLPETKALFRRDVATIDSAIRALGERLGTEIESGLLETAAKCAGDRRARFVRLLGSYALLADEAMHAPDYAGSPTSWGPEHRQAYRARMHSGAWDRERQTRSRRALAAALRGLAEAHDPVVALERVLIAEFLREIGVPPETSMKWRPTEEAIGRALEGEAFLPLRAYQERAAQCGRRYASREEWHAVVDPLIQSVVEGRFSEWRVSNEASRLQLAVLDEAQRAEWLKDRSVSHEIETKDGGRVILTTSEAQASDFGLFWATKVGGPSHGFDTMTNCALALATNARNNTILVTDPRWPNHAGRTYIRLFSLKDTGEPVLFLEGSHRDFGYPGPRGPVDIAIARHALEKARAMNVRLVLSWECSQIIAELGLRGEWRSPEYVVAPSLLVEAASVFGPHDWRQQREEVRPMRMRQFFVE